MDLVFKLAPVEMVYGLRSKVLRPGQPISSCHYKEDDDVSAFHLVALAEQSVVAISSFYAEYNESLSAKQPIRLRGMAVEPEMQSHGLGSKLLLQAIDICKKAGADLLWCNARVGVLSFYRKLDFETVGEFFDLAGIGEHYLMCRNLNN